MKIIGIAGTNGSGKDSLGQVLEDEYGWLFVSVSNMLRNGLRQKDLPIERENLRNLSAEWRRESGLGVIINKAVDVFKADKTKHEGLAIASLRNPGEADRIHELGGQVVWVDANARVRYGRIATRVRGDEDRKTYKEFTAEEQAEMNHSGDEATLNMAGVKAKADIYLKNNGSPEDFKNTIRKAMGL